MIQGFIRNRTLGSVVTRLSRVTCIVTSILTSVVTCHVCCHEYCHEYCHNCCHVPGDDQNNETSVSVATVTESENVKVRFCQKRTCPSCSHSHDYKRLCAQLLSVYHCAQNTNAQSRLFWII